MREIESTTLSDLILRDTDTSAMQADAFVATERHSGTLGGVDPTGEEAAEGMAQLVIGSAGKDTLTGGELDDTLVAARGRMTMTGGDGADTFVIDLTQIEGRHNTAVITDFEPGVDKLQFGTDAHVRKSSDHHGGTLLQVGNETIEVQGVRPNELHHFDWE
jgi:peroxidase